MKMILLLHLFLNMTIIIFLIIAVSNELESKMLRWFILLAYLSFAMLMLYAI